MDIDEDQNERFNMESLVDPCDTASFPDKKHIATGNFEKKTGIVEIVVMKGNFWRIVGFNSDGKSYLYPEEALFLVERSVLLVKIEGQSIEYSQFYELVVQHTTLPCYLTYVRLKVCV